MRRHEHPQDKRPAAQSGQPAVALIYYQPHEDARGCPEISDGLCRAPEADITAAAHYRCRPAGDGGQTGIKSACPLPTALARLFADRQTTAHAGQTHLTPVPRAVPPESRETGGGREPQIIQPRFYVPILHARIIKGSTFMV